VEQKQHLAEQDFPGLVLFNDHMIVVRATAGSAKGAGGSLNDISVLVHDLVYVCLLVGPENMFEFCFAEFLHNTAKKGHHTLFPNSSNGH
jgi:hypothetical protein